MLVYVNLVSNIEKKVVELSVFMFFFSSRRRHTRFDCDWSSDVCSSDLFSRRRLVGSNCGSPWRLRARRSTGRFARRSEERRVGKECRSRWAPNQYKKK